MPSSFCVVTRIFRAEIPYINNFFDYYINYLGVKKIYIFSFDNTVWNNYISNEFKNLYKVFYINIHKSWVQSYKKYSNEVKEDYIINADCDEYLYLHNITLNDFVKQYSEYSEIRLNWLFACANNFKTKNVNEILDKSQYKAFVKNYKTILKRQDIISPWRNNNDPHGSLRKSNNNRILHLEFSDGFFIHFACRNFYDLYLRASLQKMKNDSFFALKYFMTNNVTNIILFPYRFLCHYLFMKNSNIVNITIEIPNLKHDFSKPQEFEILKENKLILNHSRLLQINKNLAQDLDISQFKSMPPIQIVNSLRRKKEIALKEKRKLNKNK